MRSFCVDFDGVIADTGLLKRQWLRSKIGIEIDANVSDRTSLEGLIDNSVYRQMQEALGLEDTLEAAPVEGALNALNAIANHMPIYVLTARAPEKVKWARRWLAMHSLGKAVRATVSCFSRTKGRMAVGLNASVFVDNDIRHLVELPPSMCALHFDLSGRNRMNVITAKSWREVLKFVESKNGIRF